MNKEYVINGIKERLFNNCELRPTEVLVLKDYINQLELDVDSFKTKYKRANELYLDTSKKVNQPEANRDEAIEYIKDLLEHWKGNDLVERDLNTLLTMLERGKE